MDQTFYFLSYLWHEVYALLLFSKFTVTVGRFTIGLPPAATAREILSTLAKNLNSTEHSVNLNADCMKKTLCKPNKAAFLNMLICLALQ